MRFPMKVVAVGLLALSASLVGASSAATRGGVVIRCSFRMIDPARVYDDDGTGSYRGGAARCSMPLGSGTYSGTFRDKLVKYPLVAETGTTKLILRGGTVRGAYRFAGAFSAADDNYKGVMHISGGTGRFKHALGTLRLTCSKDPPNARCSGAGTVSGV